jgi:hypothetical protein
MLQHFPNISSILTRSTGPAMSPLAFTGLVCVEIKMKNLYGCNYKLQSHEVLLNVIKMLSIFLLLLHDLLT